MAKNYTGACLSLPTPVFCLRSGTKHSRDSCDHAKNVRWLQACTTHVEPKNQWENIFYFPWWLRYEEYSGFFQDQWALVGWSLLKHGVYSTTHSSCEWAVFYPSLCLQMDLSS